MTDIYIPSSVTTIGANSFKGCSTKVYTNATSTPSGWSALPSTSTLTPNTDKVNYEIAVGLREPPKAYIVPVVDDTPRAQIEVASTVTYDELVTIIGVSEENCCGWFTDDIYMTTFKPEEHLIAGETLTIYTKTASDNSNFTFALNSDGKSYNIKASSTSIRGDIVIPAKATDGTNGVLPVTELVDNAFNGCSVITNMTIGANIENIGYCSFAYCIGLTTLVIPNSVIILESSAFVLSSGLTSIYIPASVTTISAPYYGDSPFYACSSSLKIYCGATSKPSGWGTGWNYYDSSNTLEVVWGVTREQYEANYATATSDESVGVMASASAIQAHTELTTIMMALTIVVCAVISVVAGITLKKRRMADDDMFEDKE